MCGIVGIYSFKDHQCSWPKEVIEAMLEKISHRGPDGSGVYVEPGIFLGHKRLAVLDTSPKGNQPMVTSDKRVVITFNGEIYNFREIRQELEERGYHFISYSSDTEVLVNAWAEWGEECLKKLDGIFAFVVYDRISRSLFLVRDHLGVKPLFYMCSHGQLFFSSELFALFTKVNPCPSFNYRDLNVYFSFNYLPAPFTGLEGVSQLEAGHLLRVDSTGIHLKRYWAPAYTSTVIPQRPEVLTERFNELLVRNVKKQLVSDVPIGFFLSGGLDSYAVAASAHESGCSAPAFTLGFDEPAFDETQAAHDYAHFLHILHHVEKFKYDEAGVRATLCAMGELLADPSCLPLYQLSRFARKEITVALSGDGGDELLAGYDTYFAGEVTPWLRKLPRGVRALLLHVPRRFSSQGSRYGLRMVGERMFAASEVPVKWDHATFRLIFSDSLKRKIYSPEFWKVASECDPRQGYVSLMDEVPPGRSYLTARQHADLVFHLPSILAKVDRMSMAHGLEVRVPLLSKELVDFCINLPDASKRLGMRGKRILRQAFTGRIPADALRRAKAGFLPPVDKWFREPGVFSMLFGEYLQQAKSSLGVLNWEAVETLWKQHRYGNIEAGYSLFGILQFMNWSFQCRR